MNRKVLHLRAFGDPQRRELAAKIGMAQLHHAFGVGNPAQLVAVVADAVLVRELVQEFRRLSDLLNS